jgi:hypothetical protein
VKVVKVVGLATDRLLHLFRFSLDVLRKLSTVEEVSGNLGASGSKKTDCAATAM